MKNLLQRLSMFSGKYVGGGVNHENDEFYATFELVPLVSGTGVGFAFRALLKDGTCVHEESSIIGKNPKGTLSLFAATSNTPFVLEHVLVESELRDSVEGLALEFRYGTIEERGTFREKLRLEFQSGGKMTYAFSWGMPGGDFADRSQAVMHQ